MRKTIKNRESKKQERKRPTLLTLKRKEKKGRKEEEESLPKAGRQPIGFKRNLPPDKPACLALASLFLLLPKSGGKPDDDSFCVSCTDNRCHWQLSRPSASVLANARSREVITASGKPPGKNSRERSDNWRHGSKRCD
ncbi:hypothetical protein BJ508DRAFT_9197 [Ascobolus immersus RN42]|uniref:Uncharacterized protein n=1 Tax=Ascobolus immersus RN42 TaxID=1160509 RepID=A0A3N4I3I0_ASCIM|nr:hypothetical protein BJ508DRAFT_9197 [Ascobolus immersus RN42]